jgi:hypothetical protein
MRTGVPVRFIDDMVYLVAKARECLSCQVFATRSNGQLDTGLEFPTRPRRKSNKYRHEKSRPETERLRVSRFFATETNVP